MNLLLLRTPNGLMPSDDESVRAVQKVAVGDTILVEYKPRRNTGLHRKYWGFINAVFNNMKVVDKKRLNIFSSASLHEAIKYRVGHIETFFSLEGKQLIKTKPTDFGNMDDELFSIFFESAKDVGVELLDTEAVREIITFL